MLKNSKVVFISVTLKSWSGRKLWTLLGTCEYGNEPSGSIKYGEFLD